MSVASPTPRHRRRIPLRLAIALFLIAAVLTTGAILGVHNYRQTSRLLLAASDDLFTRMGRDVLLELGRTAGPVQSLVDVLAAQSIDAASPDERARRVPAFVAALRRNPAMTAVYVGDDTGAFFLVRPASDPRVRAAVRAPEGTAYVVQTVVPTAAGLSATFVHLRDDLSILATVARPDFTFDARTRDWYRDALRGGGQVRTDPYVFFTTREPGITLARARSDRRAVVGADVTLDGLAALLRNEKAGPAAELYLLTSDGHVLARRHAPQRPPGPGPADGSLRLPSLAESGGPAAPAMAARFPAAAGERNFTFDAAGDAWIGGIDRIDADGGAPLFLASAAPMAELLADARRARTEAWLVTALLMLAAIPIAWVAAGRLARPLHRLAERARAMQAFDFSGGAPVTSTVREIDQLGAAVADAGSTVRHFLDVSGALAAERDLERLVARVLDETMQLARAEAASIHLFDAPRRTLSPMRYARSDGSAVAAGLAPIDVAAVDAARHPVAAAAVGGRTVVAELAPGDAEGRAWLGEDAARLGPDGIGVIAVPLRNRAGEVDGVLALLRGGARADAVPPQVIAFVENVSGVAAIAIETRRLIGEQKALLEAFIQLIAAAIDAKSPYTGGHCQRVPELTRLLAQAACDAREGPYRDFALDDDEWEAVRIASWLHDCGKVTTPEYVVDKATKLETLCDRIHEVRMRFEVLKRDAEIAYWRGRAEGGDPAALRTALDAERDALDDDFAFVAACNVGGESLAEADVARLRRVAGRTWQRTIDDRQGVSWEERKRMERTPAVPLPATEALLADKPEHVIERDHADRMPRDNPWGFKLDMPQRKYDRGELHNLAIGRGTLTAEERYKINDHIVQTIVMLQKLPFPRHLANVPELAGGHHEKMDGTGYPRGLTREQMSPVARMMAIADVFEALTAADRPYKKGKTLSESLRIMARMRSEHHIDPELFELFLRAGLHRRYAERYLRPEQIDDVDVEALLAAA